MTSSACWIAHGRGGGGVVLMSSVQMRNPCLYECVPQFQFCVALKLLTVRVYLQCRHRSFPLTRAGLNACPVTSSPLRVQLMRPMCFSLPQKCSSTRSLVMWLCGG